MAIHHAFACPFPASGHIRPFMAFITHVVDKHPSVIFTVVTHKMYVQMLLDEVKRSRISETASGRIRVIGVVKEDPAPGMVAVMGASADLIGAVPSAYELIARCNVITCTSTGTTFDYHDIPPPKLALIDFVGGYNVGQIIKPVTPDVKLVVFGISTVGSTVRMCAPKELGGLVSWEEDVKTLLKKDPSMAFKDAAAQLLHDLSGKKAWPNPEGMELYAYELIPQALPPMDVYQMSMDGITLVNVVADGMVFSSTESFEPYAFQAFREWYEGTRGKKMYCIGARSAFRMLEPGRTPAPNAKDKEIFHFLDKQPPKSTWLISFGTIFYPLMHLNQLYAVINTLLDSKTPFILSRQSLMASCGPGLPAELEKAITESGLGLVAQHVPQQHVLQHPSIGAFITHGGVNSMFEFIVSEVVPIFWPFAGDQPGHAAYLTHKDCGFELIQVRTGEGAKPSLRGGEVKGTDDAISAEVAHIVNELQGEVGARKRKNLKVMKDEFVKAMSDGGLVDIATTESLRFAFGDSF